jgi:ABC-2 type transport system ATP-binding protein
MSAGVDQRIETGATTSVELRSLEKTYRSPAGPVHTVRGVDIAVHPGETVALLGPNGAGKSTTIDMLLGLQFARLGFGCGLRSAARTGGSAGPDRGHAPDGRRPARADRA